MNTSLLGAQGVQGVSRVVILLSVVTYLAATSVASQPIQPIHQFGSGSAGSAQISADGQRILVGTNNAAHLWDVASGALVQSVTGHSLAVFSVAISPDGTRLATGGWDMTVKIWETATGQELLSIEDIPSLANSLAFSPDGTLLAIGGSGGEGGSLRDADTGTLVRALDGAGAILSRFTFSPDGTQLMQDGVGGNTARIYDVATGAVDVEITFPFSSDTMAFSADGSRIVMLNNQIPETQVWNVATASVIMTLTDPSPAMAHVAMSPDGSQFAGAISSGLGEIGIWDAATGALLQTLPERRVWQISYTSDGASLLAVSSNQVQLWDIEQGVSVRTLDDYTAPVRAVAVSNDADHALIGRYDGTVELVDLASRASIWVTQDNPLDVADVAFLPDGLRMVTAGQDGVARLRSMANGDELGRFEGHTARIWSLAVSPDGSLLITGSGDGTARLWDMETETELHAFTFGGSQVRSVSFTPDGSQVLLAANDVGLWDVASKARTRLYALPSRIAASAVLSHDGAKMAAAYWSGGAHLWDTDREELLLTFTTEPNDDQVSALAHVPGQNAVAGAGWFTDGMVRLWDAETGATIQTLEGHGAPANCLALSPDGGVMLTGSNDGTALLWSLPDLTVPFRWGDVNNDGVTGTLDAALMLQYDAFLIDRFPCCPGAVGDIPRRADVNGDGVVGALDASLVLQFDATAIACFPVDLNCDGMGPE